MVLIQQTSPVRLLQVALCALLLPFAAAAQQDVLDEDARRSAGSLRDELVQPGLAYELVESLTTEVGPRLAGTEADARAVAWAEQRFRDLGFDRVWRVPVTFPFWQRGREQAEVVAPFPQPLHILALGGSVGTGAVPLEAEVIEFPTLSALIEAPADVAAGRIVFINYRMQRFRDGRGYGPAVAARGSGATEAAKKGAVGLLIRSIGTDSDRFPHTGTMRYGADVERIPAAALSNPDADLLANMLRRGQAVKVRLDIGAETRGEKTSYNVIGDITGRDQPDEVVVIGGHLDSWDVGTGAIDDASGVGITMAAGASILRLPQRPRRTVRVIAWAAEEIGLLGARAYASAQAESMSRHIIAAESDFGAGRIYALRAGIDPAAWPLLEAIALQLAPLGIELQREGGGPGPDVIPLTQRNVPWAQLAQDGSDYFDYHHTQNDTLDKVDTDDLDQQARAYAVFAYLAAEAEQDFGRLPPEQPTTD